MNQFQLELIYQPVFFIVIIIAVNVFLEVYTKTPLFQTIFYLITLVLFAVAMILTYQQQKQLEQQPVIFNAFTAVMIALIIAITLGFFAYMRN